MRPSLAGFLGEFEFGADYPQVYFAKNPDGYCGVGGCAVAYGPKGLTSTDKGPAEPTGLSDLPHARSIPAIVKARSWEYQGNFWVVQSQVYAWVIQHPFRIIVFAHGRLRRNERRVETDALSKIFDGQIHMESLHARFLLIFGASALVEAHSVLQSWSASAQQFSVRNPISWFICKKFAR